MAARFMEGASFVRRSNPESFASEVPQKQAREVVDTLIRQLHTFREFNVSEIIEGGSLGHGTPVLTNYDIDLVLYSRDITGDEIIRQNGCESWLKELNQFLARSFGSDYRHLKMTSRSVQFNFKGIIDVDLLVSPYWADQHSLYSFLARIGKDDRSRFTVCASKWQVQFFSTILANKPKARDCIIKAKQWRDEKWPKGEGGYGRPSSFLMSLLVVKAYQQDPHNVTRALIQMVENAGETFDICWDGHAYYERRKYPNLLPSRPRVLDPANPANNVWKTGLKDYKRGEKLCDYEPGDGNSTILKRHIRTISLE